MTNVIVFLYAMLASFVTLSLHRNRQLGRPSSEMLTMAGWGLFSLSTTLAVLLAGVAIALGLGFNLANAGLALPPV
ncbi:hypothetical protein [Sphingomonas sp.]|uniref:hypothetical protein n=1 Tax=Sphingomonas sp. TaxID=28214 RepID=UPI001B163EF6|nr:hypothetical protein [Sphingomonas sp.]MBO9712221.1 hypothetical protein [Sphingomonas sp.]